MANEALPITQLQAKPVVVIVVPSSWLVLGGNYAELLIQRIDMEAVDFYPRTAT